jgi:deoxyribose-phosphate aldolase
MPDTEDRVAKAIESTLLRSEAGEKEIRALCAEAIELGVHGVCVLPYWVKLASRLLAESGLKVTAACAFPHGSMNSDAKKVEAKRALEEGASEIDTVLNVGAFLTGGPHSITLIEDLSNYAMMCRGFDAVLKIIVEAPVLDEKGKWDAAKLVVRSGAQFLKTGTGTRGPCTVEDVELFKDALDSKAKIKAAGGIDSRGKAEAMLGAGADRIGTSHANAILRGE